MHEIETNTSLDATLNRPMISRYDWILFDADHTLFHFNDFEGLRTMFAKYGVMFTEADYKQYKLVNKPLWVQYQNGEISAPELQVKRFVHWQQQYGVDAQELNDAFLLAMVRCCPPLDGATELLAALRGRVKLGIITNGFTLLQEARLNQHNLRHHIDLLVVSEIIGIAKPDRRIFEYALSKMNNVNPARVLMVGDTPASDILGGNNIGMDTCWLNHHAAGLPEDIKPTFQVSTLTQLQQILLHKSV